MYRKIITGVFAVLATLQVVAENKNNLAIADEYIEAYQAFDMAKMAGFYVEDSQFIDPTSAVFGPDNTYIMSGKMAIVEKLNSFVEQSGPIRLEFDIKHRYEAAGNVVYSANVLIKTGKSDQYRTACAPITTIVQIKDGKVVEHRDYFDYHHYVKTLSPKDQSCPSEYGR